MYTGEFNNDRMQVCCLDDELRIVCSCFVHAFVIRSSVLRDREQ